MNPSDYAESIEASTMLLRDTAPWLEKPYTLSSRQERCRAQHVGLRGRKPYRRRAPPQLHIGPAGNVTCMGHREGGMCTCKTAQK